MGITKEFASGPKNSPLGLPPEDFRNFLRYPFKISSKYKGGLKNSRQKIQGVTPRRIPKVLNREYSFKQQVLFMIINLLPRYLPKFIRYSHGPFLNIFFQLLKLVYQVRIVYQPFLLIGQSFVNICSRWQGNTKPLFHTPSNHVTHPNTILDIGLASFE